MELAKEMHKCFLGLERAYGYYNLSNSQAVAGEKLLGKVKTLIDNVTDDLWKKHLDGEIGIGIVPINDQSRCYFGAIDIDVYKGLDVEGICNKVYSNNLPLIPFRSKSGGIHLFIFLSEAVPAKLLREKLLEMSSYLGYAKAEIFPKQVEILAERGDVGQWINMPYQNNASTNRYAYSAEAKPLEVHQFLMIYNAKKLTLAQLEKYHPPVTSDFSDGPPCLQKLLANGLTAGSRNDCMFNLASYLKKAIGLEFDKQIEEVNEKYCDPRLSADEVVKIIKSVKARDYSYTCSKSPLKDFCNMTVCRQRKHGIGGMIGMPELTGLTKFDSNPPVWFVDVEGGGRLELSTEDLQSQQRFQRKCMDKLNSFPPPIKPPVWQAIIQKLMENVTIVEAPKSSSTKGMFYEYLEIFCTARAQARVVDEILMGKPYTTGNKHYFRLIDLNDFLERNKFREFKVHQISSMIKDISGEPRFWNIKGKGVNLWSIPEFASQTEKFDVEKAPGSDLI